MAKTKKVVHKDHRAPRHEFEARQEFVRALIHENDGKLTYRQVNDALADKFGNVRVMDPKVMSRLFKEAGYEKRPGRPAGYDAATRIMKAQEEEQIVGVAGKDVEVSRLEEVALPQETGEWRSVCHRIGDLMQKDHIREARLTQLPNGQLKLTVQQVVTKSIPV